MAFSSEYQKFFRSVTKTDDVVEESFSFFIWMTVFRTSLNSKKKLAAWWREFEVLEC